MFDIKPDSRMSTDEKLLYNIQELLLKITGLPQDEASSQVPETTDQKPVEKPKQTRAKPRKKRTSKGADKK